MINTLHLWAHTRTMWAIGVITVAAVVFLASSAVAFAALDYVETDEECSAGQEIWAFVDTGPALSEAWTTLDNQTTHGWDGGYCPDESCRWLYGSGNPSSQRSIVQLNAWSQHSVFISGFQCLD